MMVSVWKKSLANSPAAWVRRNGPVRPRQARPTDLTTQHGDLVAQDQQLGGHRRIAAGGLGQPAERPNGGHVHQAYEHALDRA
jgi:hypothetical protein